MFGPIQLGGLASGLDTGAIIDALVAAESRQITLLEQQKSVEKSKLDLIGDLEDLVDELRDKANELSTLSGFMSYVATPSAEGVANLSVTGTTAVGSHTLTVNALAAADRWTWDGVADADTTQLGDGSIDFTYNGTAYSVSVSGASSLNDIALAINDDADMGAVVTASVINVGTDASPSYKLVLAGNDTGADYALSGLSTTIAGLANQTNLTAAQNAEIVLDGLTVQRSNNQFEGVLDGVAIDVVAAGQSMTFSVDADRDAIKANIQSFVDAYNDVIEFINAQSTYDEEGGPGGDLFGDTALSSIRSTIQTALLDVDIAVVQADTTGFTSIGLLGLELQSDGTISLDTAKLDEKLNEDLDAFADLFVDTDGFDNAGAAKNTPDYYVDTTADSGVFDDLFRAIDQAVKTITSDDGDKLKGVFGRRKETFNANIKRMNDQIEALELRLEQFEADLVARFSALEEVMSGLNAQQAYLSALPTLQS